MFLVPPTPTPTSPPPAGALTYSIISLPRLVLRDMMCDPVVETPFITHVSETKIRMSCTTARYKYPDVHTYAPSLQSTHESCAQVRLAFQRFPTTAIQSLPVVNRVCPRYQKEVTIARGWLYALNAITSPSRASYSTSLWRFYYSLLVHREVVGWRLLRSTHGMNMLQSGK